jgi:hypothetical protein
MRPAMLIVDPVVLDLQDDYVFKRCLGKEEHFRNFERFFLNEITNNGYQATLQKYLLDGSELADEMLVHIYMGECTIFTIAHALIEADFADRFIISIQAMFTDSSISVSHLSSGNPFS